MNPGSGYEQKVPERERSSLTRFFFLFSELRRKAICHTTCYKVLVTEMKISCTGRKSYFLAIVLGAIIRFLIFIIRFLIIIIITTGQHEQSK